MSGRKPIVDEGPPQLMIGGGEISTAKARATSTPGPGLSQVQRFILAKLRKQGSIRGVEAGVIVHECRVPPRCGFGAKRHLGERGIACCGYAATDGMEALKRMRERGLVEQIAPGGPWRAVSPR